MTSTQISSKYQGNINAAKADLKYRTGRNEEREPLITYNAYSDLNVKTKLLRLRDIWVRQLMCIKGMSVCKACIIANQFPTMRSFVDALKQLPDAKAREAFLMNLGDAGRRSINKALAQTTVQIFDVS